MFDFNGGCVMKRVGLFALLLIAVGGFAMVTTACDVFLNPQNGRENPNDPDSPVPAPDGVYAEYVEAEEMVKIYFDLPEDKKNTKGFVTIRKTGSAPTSIHDGKEVSRDKWGDVEEAGYIGDTGYKEGKLNYYGVWAYGEDDYAEHYTGPVSGSAGVPTEIVLEAVADGYIDNTDTAFFTEDLLRINYLGGPMEVTELSMVKFDVSSILGFRVAYLNLYCYDVPSSGWLEIHRIIQNWSEESPPDSFATVNSYSFYSMEGGFSDSEVTGAGWVDFDVTTIVEDWVLTGNTNYGLLIRPDDGAALDIEVLFNAKESESNIPELVIYGWE